MHNLKRNGFTIVELLIVIVVISILASVTVVAYNGMKQRATNSAVQAALAASEKAIMLHYTASSDTAIKAATPGWYHESLTTMGGACIGKSWPSLAELQAMFGGYPEDEVRAMYCGVNGGNSSVSRAEVQQKLDTAVAASSVKDAFSKVPSFPAITLDETSGGGSNTVRGIRYAFNNSTSAPKSYLFYPFNGKQCMAGDASIRATETVWPSAGNGEWNGPFTTGGDYTSNNTVYCVRTIAYK